MSCNFIDKLRSPKLLNMAIFDWVATFLVAVILSLILYLITKINYLILLILIFSLLIVLGIITHKVLGIPTMLNYYLGLNNKENVLKNRKEC